MVLSLTNSHLSMNIFTNKIHNNRGGGGNTVTTQNKNEGTLLRSNHTKRITYCGRAQEVTMAVVYDLELKFWQN